MAARELDVHGPLDLESTLFSGQAFRWSRQADGWFRGFVLNTPLEVCLDGERLQWRSEGPLSEADLTHYFRLDETHEDAIRAFPRDAFVRQAVERFPGLRLLRQDPWETLVSFIISQNSNEAKIRGTIEALAGAAGREIPFQSEIMWAFPSPSEVAALDEATLRRTGMGYRSSYVSEAAHRAADGRLRPGELPDTPYETAFAALLDVPGVGEKVADCILLYGCDHLEAFPTDVWVRRLMHESFYRPRRRPTHERLRAYAWKRFGPFAGYAQHYLFHYRRVVGRLDANPS